MPQLHVISRLAQQGMLNLALDLLTTESQIVLQVILKARAAAPEALTMFFFCSKF